MFYHMAFTSIPLCVFKSFLVWLASLPLFSPESSLSPEFFTNLFLAIDHSAFYYNNHRHTFPYSIHIFYNKQLDEFIHCFMKYKNYGKI